MATTTANLRLTKPLGAERYDINVFNNNADLIDAGFHATTGHDHSGRAGEGPQLTEAALAAGAVTTAKLAPDTFHAEQFHNALPNGDFESWSAGGTAAPDGWALARQCGPGRARDLRRQARALRGLADAAGRRLRSSPRPGRRPGWADLPARAYVHPGRLGLRDRSQSSSAGTGRRRNHVHLGLSLRKFGLGVADRDDRGG